MHLYVRVTCSDHSIEAMPVPIIVISLFPLMRFVLDNLANSAGPTEPAETIDFIVNWICSAGMVASPRRKYCCFYSYGVRARVIHDDLITSGSRAAKAIDLVIFEIGGT